MARIVVAMSGGVDSSVTAALLHAQGHDVIGVTLDVWPSETPQAQRQRKACCGTSAVEDARRVADRLGIPYYVLNFRELFRETVIADFVREYQRGPHPEPLRALQPARQVPAGPRPRRHSRRRLRCHRPLRPPRAGRADRALRAAPRS